MEAWGAAHIGSEVWGAAHTGSEVWGAAHTGSEVWGAALNLVSKSNESVGQLVIL